MHVNDIILWSGWIITIISFLVNIIQYFRFKEMDSKCKDITKNASALLEGIRSSLTDSIEVIEKSTPPPQAETALSSLKGSVKSVVANINSWLKNYGFSDSVIDG